MRDVVGKLGARCMLYPLVIWSVAETSLKRHDQNLDLRRTSRQSVPLVQYDS